MPLEYEPSLKDAEGAYKYRSDFLTDRFGGGERVQRGMGVLALFGLAAAIVLTVVAIFLFRSGNKNAPWVAVGAGGAGVLVVLGLAGFFRYRSRPDTKNFRPMETRYLVNGENGWESRKGLTWRKNWNT